MNTSSRLGIVFGSLAFALSPAMIATATAGSGVHQSQQSESRSPKAVLPTERAPYDTETRRLHDARQMEDRDLVRHLEESRRFEAVGGESAGGTTLLRSNTVGAPGSPLPTSGQNHRLPSGAPFAGGAFGDDIHVRSSNPTTAEWNPSLVSDSRGHLYVAWQDNSLTYDYIQLYKSVDSGNTWFAIGFLSNSNAHLREPSIAVGEGISDELLVAYVVVDGVNPTVPEVATKPLDSGSFTVNSVPVWDWEGYSKPVVWTDSHQYGSWYAYLTCEGIFDSSAGNVNVCFWRSQNYGTTWADQEVVLGNTDVYTWIDPDGTFGTSGNNVYIGCYREDVSMLYAVRSDDFGLNWNTPVAVNIVPGPTNYAVDPEIAAATDNDNVMMCCTMLNGGTDCIGQNYSTNGGDDWTTLWPLEGSDTNVHEWSVALTANEGGGSWYLTFTGPSRVYCSGRPQDLSDFWQSSPDRVDDTSTASQVFPNKGIASNWTTDVVAIVWTDFRDGSPDYDTYFDYADNDNVFNVPDEVPTIQGAINIAQDGGTVSVGPGVYEENIDFLGKAITVRGVEGAQSTHIDGQAVTSVVTFQTGEDNDSILEGFTIKNGMASAGGGIYCNDASPTIRNNVITDNEAAFGAGVFVWDSHALLTNNTITLNTASVDGGGLYIKSGFSDPWISNTILWDDFAPNGPEIFVNSGSPTVSYCNVEGGWPGVSNINANPLFVDVFDEDFHIYYHSPCRDAGWNGAPGLPNIDFDGNERNIYGTPDIGADEFGRHLYATGDATPGGTLNLKFTGIPGSTPVALLVGTEVLDPPVTSPLGDWYLSPPLLGPFFLPSLPFPGGVVVLSDVIPGFVPTPWDIPMQGYIEPRLTDLWVVRVR